MKFLLNANLAPRIARWLSEEFEIDCIALLTLENGATLKDEEVFKLARKENAVVITKDSDFANLVRTHGAPPQIIVLSVGNCTNQQLIEILKKNFPAALAEIKNNIPLVELKN